MEDGRSRRSRPRRRAAATRVRASGRRRDRSPRRSRARAPSLPRASARARTVASVGVNRSGGTIGPRLTTEKRSGASRASIGCSGSPCLTAFSIRLRARMAKASGSRSDSGASPSGRREFEPAAEIEVAVDILGDEPQHRGERPRRRRDQPAAFGLGQLQELLREPCEPAQRRGDRGRALPRRALRQFGDRGAATGRARPRSASAIRARCWRRSRARPRARRGAGRSAH